MQIPLIALCAVLFVTGPEAERAKGPVEQSPGKLTLSQCLVSLIEEAQVPAQEAGILVDLTAREGQQVAAGEKLARIDDAQTVNAQQIATLKLQVSQERAGNNINVRYAQASSDVARVEYEQAWRANQKTPGTFSDSEIRRLGLSDRRAVLAIEQAALDLRVAGLEAKVQEAELAAATTGVQRRQVNSPLDGTVVKVNRHAGEWVQPGDFVIHVVRMDRLKIEGFLPATDTADRDGRALARGYLPSQIDQRPVTVTVQMAGGRRENFEGKVAFVSPLVQAGGVYRFWVEVVNRKEGNHWLLLPGLMAELTIHLQ
jgi:multidrug efflux pump subunit AcrA (membrane-fusion protein)